MQYISSQLEMEKKLKNGKKLLFCCGCVAVKPVMPRCSVPEAVTVGSSPELRCIENEGFPQSQYQWFKNNEELPEDPKTSSKFYNSTYTMNTETGSLVSVLCYHASKNISYFLFSFFKNRGLVLCSAQPVSPKGIAKIMIDFTSVSGALPLQNRYSPCYCLILLLCWASQDTD